MTKVRFHNKIFSHGALTVNMNNETSPIRGLRFCSKPCANDGKMCHHLTWRFTSFTASWREQRKFWFMTLVSCFLAKQQLCPCCTEKVRNEAFCLVCLNWFLNRKHLIHICLNYCIQPVPPKLTLRFTLQYTACPIELFIYCIHTASPIKIDSDVMECVFEF